MGLSVESRPPPTIEQGGFLFTVCKKHC